MYQFSIHLQRVKEAKVLPQFILLFHRHFENKREKKIEMKECETEHRNGLNDFKSFSNIIEIAFFIHRAG